MRSDLVQFGDVIFLDAQQRQFNSSGFQYISPILHDDDGKIVQGAESIVIPCNLRLGLNRDGPA
jgi:hypothetical protein